MNIISASDERVITNMGMTYLAYTFSQEYARYDELKEHSDRLKSFTETVDSVPTVYDIKMQSKDGEEFLSITGEKPQYSPLNERTINELSLESCQEIVQVLCDTLSEARKYGIYHLDIGFHSIGYDENLSEVCIFDWYDSVLQFPAKPPFYISEYYPAELDSSQSEYSEVVLQKAENHQVCCFVAELFQSNRLEVPKVVQQGCLGESDQRPTLETIRDAVLSR